MRSAHSVCTDHDAGTPLISDLRDRPVVAPTVMMLTCLVLGLLAGGMLVMGVSFVSLRRSRSPRGCGTWFAL
jgi:hypothetical protein